MAMEPGKAVKEYKDANAKLQIEVGEYAKKVGQLTLEKDWAVGKLEGLDLSKKLEMVDESELKKISVVKQCELLNLSRSNIYYAPVMNEHKLAIKEEIKSIFAPQGHFLASLTAKDTNIWSTCVLFHHKE